MRAAFLCGGVPRRLRGLGFAAAGLDQQNIHKQQRDAARHADVGKIEDGKVDEQQVDIIDDLPGGKADDDTVREIQKNVAKAASESASAGPGVDLSREIDKISPKDNDSDSPTRQFTPVNARSFSFDDLRYGGKEEGK